MKTTLALVLLAAALNLRAEARADVPAAAVAGAAPAVRFATNVVDVGRVLGGSSVASVFTFTNTGREALVVNSVRSTCGCTKVKDWTRSVAPGATGEIALQLDAPNAAGSLSKAVLVSCNDPAQPEFSIKLVAQLWKAVDIAPPLVPFDFVSGRDTNRVKTVRITSLLDGPIELSAPEVGRPDFAAELKPIDPGREFELTVRSLSKPVSDSTLMFPVTMKTSSREVPVLSVKVMAVVPQPIEVSPSRIVLLEPASTPVLVDIRNHLENDLRLSSPAVSIPGATVKLEEKEPGKIFRIVLDLPPGSELASGQNEKLTVETSNPGHPKLEIPIVGRPASQPYLRRGYARRSVVPRELREISARATADHQHREAQAEASASVEPGDRPVTPAAPQAPGGRAN